MSKNLQINCKKANFISSLTSLQRLHGYRQGDVFRKRTYPT